METSAGYQDAEVGAVVAVVSGRVDAEVKCFVFIGHHKPINGFADQFYVAGFIHAVDAGRGSFGDHFHLIDGIFENELAPVVKL